MVIVLQLSEDIAVYNPIDTPGRSDGRVKGDIGWWSPLVLSQFLEDVACPAIKYRDWDTVFFPRVAKKKKKKMTLFRYLFSDKRSLD